jgi:LysM repeat protein
MGKEVKIGLAVIGLLLCVFGGVLFFRLRREAPGTAQKKVAAAKKDGKAKSDKKESPKPKKEDNERPRRSAGKTAWSTPSKAESQDERREADQQLAPSLDTSPYRDRSDTARRQRYQDVAAGENSAEREPASIEDAHDRTGDDPAGQDLAAPDPAELDVAQQDPPATMLVIPDRQGVRQSGHMALAGDDRAEGTDASDDRADEDAQDRSAVVTADRLRLHGQVEGDFREPSDEAEPESNAAELVEDESELRPGAKDRYSKRRSEAQQDEVQGDHLDRDQLNGGRLDRDPFGGVAALEHQEMANDAVPAASEPVEESPRPFRQRPETDSYVVEPNDNFWRISQKVYGTGAYFKALEEHNRRQYGDRRLINVGDVISVPPLTVLRENYADLCPKPRNAPADRETLLTSSPARGARGTHTYTVAEGDTLFDIARHELGKASRWAEIYQLNREQLGEDFNYLSPGMQLVLPERAKDADPIASRPRRESYR